jgi:hypothetical protein
MRTISFFLLDKPSVNFASFLVIRLLGATQHVLSALSHLFIHRLATFSSEKS